MDTFSLLSQGLYLPQLEEKFQDHSEIIISLHLNLTLKTEMVQVWNHAEWCPFRLAGRFSETAKWSLHLVRMRPINVNYLAMLFISPFFCHWKITLFASLYFLKIFYRGADTSASFSTLIFRLVLYHEENTSFLITYSIITFYWLFFIIFVYRVVDFLVIIALWGLPKSE